MKTKITILFLMGLILLSPKGFAQKDKKDKTKATDQESTSTQNLSQQVTDSMCLIYISLFNESAKNKQYADAYGPWLSAYNECPGANKVIYTRGREILQWKLGQAKAELYEYIYQEGEAIFINKKNQYLQQMAEKAGFIDASRKIEYCLKPLENNIITGEIVDCSPYLIMKCTTNEGTFDMETKLIGVYNAENVLAAVAVGNFFGVHNEQIKHGIENYQPQNNRSQFSVTQHNKLIIDTYNANPTSMQAAILNFADINFSPKTLILGDMLELGKQSKKEHQNIINLLQQKNFQNVFLVGEQFSKVNKTYPSFENVENLINYLEQHPLCNQYILIKGSRGIHLEKVLPFL
jgi:UDP-N-acetylmuramoyl-tripeptide--D-alanyl-D-alanine ligase